MEDADIHHRVVIAGQVTETRTGRALSGAQVLITNAPTAFVEPLVIAAKLLKITDAAMVKPQAKLNNPGATNGERLQAAQTILDFLQARGLFMPWATGSYPGCRGRPFLLCRPACRCLHA